ncbi:MAG TPA: NAD(P)/FAD-dependent oxidoreductase [Chthonomonadales bacterium]|nr:NAD(P)/FAD-dependent oxidoreductase [Chthonomonadales bacterium]
MSDGPLYDVTIIGGGPVGLFGAFYAGMRGMRTQIVDSLPELGGQLATLYPEKYVYDMPGFPRVIARDLAAHLIEQGTRFRPTLALSERIESLERLPDGRLRLASRDRAHYSRTAIICAGAGAFSPKRLLQPSVVAFEGRGVHYFVDDTHAFAGKRVVVVGGGDSALDWAMALEPVAACVTVVHRSAEFRAHEESIHWLLSCPRVHARLHCEVALAEGNGSLERVVLRDNRTGEVEALDADALLVTIGFTATLGPITRWGLHLEGQAIVVDAHMETNLTGVYAAGDACTYQGKLKLIATGVGEVCVAVNYAKRRVDPSARIFPGHSSHLNL